MTAPLAHADWSMETQTRIDDPSGQAQIRSGRLTFDANHLRMEFSEGPELSARQRTLVLFDAEKQTVRAVDEARRSYVQLDRTEIAALAERVARARAEMEARLPSLQPEEQAIVRQMIRDMSPGTPSTDPVERLVPREETRLIAEQEATLHDLMIEDRLVGEVWVAPVSAFGMKPDDLAVFGAFSGFQNTLIERIGVMAARSFGGEPLALFERADGVPLLVRRIQGGRVESETSFGSIHAVDPDPALYTLPPDYRRGSGPGGAPPPSGRE